MYRDAKDFSPEKLPAALEVVGCCTVATRHVRGGVIKQVLVMRTIGFDLVR